MDWWTNPQNTCQGRIPKGFTLLEVMMALAILAIVFVVLLGLRNRDMVLAKHASNLTAASLLAQEKLVEAELAGFPELGKQKGDFGKRNENFTWEQTVVPMPLEQVREVQIRVMWNEGQHEEDVTLVSYIFNQNSAIGAVE